MDYFVNGCPAFTVYKIGKPRGITVYSLFPMKFKVLKHKLF